MFMCVSAFAGKQREELQPIKLIRERCIEQLDLMRRDHMRRLNPTPYKVHSIDYIHYYLLKAVDSIREGTEFALVHRKFV